jgi:uncharacterized RDD family membrane protein YckC
MISSDLTIETPEGISFTYELASLSDRAFAFLLDMLIRIGIVLVLGFIGLIAWGVGFKGFAGIWLIIFFVVEWGYYVFWEQLWDGQSPGKRVFGLRVVRAEGHPIGFFDSALRNLLRAADILPFTYAVGAISAFATRHFQRLGDLAAGTVVIREKQRGLVTPNLTLETLKQIGGTERHGHVTLSNRERRLLQEFAVRQAWLHPARREQLAEILAEGYRRRFGDLGATTATDLLLKLHATAAQQGQSLSGRPAR